MIPPWSRPHHFCFSAAAHIFALFPALPQDSGELDFPRSLLPLGSVQPELCNVTWIGFQFAALDALDDIGQRRVGAADEPDLFTLARNQAVEEFDLGAAALLHVLTHRGALLGCGAACVLETLFVARTCGFLVSFAGARDRFGRQVQDFLQLIAVRLSDANRFAAETRREAPDRIILQHVAAAEARAGREPVLHGVGDQLRPPLAPKIAGHFGAVGIGDQTANLLRALSDAAVHFAGAKYGMRRAVLGGAAVNVAGLRQIDRDAAPDATERLAPADDASDRFFI